MASPRWFRKTYRRLLATLVAFVVVAVAVAAVWLKLAPPSHDRSPASSYEGLNVHQDLHSPVEDGETASRARRGDPSPGAGGSGLVLTSASKSTVTVNEVFNRTGIMGHLRARRVVFHESAFQESVLRDRTVDLDLFDDYKPQVKLYPPSAFAGNDGLYTGQLAHDPRAAVKLSVQNGQLTGSIESVDHKIQLISAGGNELYVIETAP